MVLRSIMRGVERLRRCTDGAVVVEFAISVWLLIILMVGAMEFGRAFYHHRLITNSVRDASRYLARVEDRNDPAFQANARNLAMRGSIDPTAPLLLSYWNDANTVQFLAADYDNAAGDYRCAATCAVIRAVATVPYTPPASFLGALGINAITFSVTHEERFIGE
ncbi:MAG: TadE/TadG family type IV pilus assembly protein [Alphaproteobacteria bacterium]